MPNICIIGLGNPGIKYDGTRHNVGKDWVKAVTTDLHLPLKSKKKIESTIAISADEKIIWGYPDNYVNESGHSVNKIIKSNNLNLEQMIIIHDDLDLPVGSLKLKIGGGHGGHNGLRDIFEKTGSNDYIRIRIGVGHPGNKDLVSNWVLNKFHPTDKEYLDKAFDLFASNFNLICDQTRHARG